MLTDYHVHLRPDGLQAGVEQYHTPANAERYRAAAEERGIAELGVSEHIYRFVQALELWRHPFWESYAPRRPRRATASSCASETDLRLGIEADFVPGAEDRIASCSTRATSTTWSARSTSSATAPSTWTTTACGTRAHPEQVWRRYFETVAESARSGLFDIIAHPDLVKIGAPGGRCPTATCAATTSWRSKRSPRPGSPSRSRPRACASRSARSTRRRRSSRCAWKRACRWRSPATRTARGRGAATSRALELLAALGVGELCVFERRARPSSSRCGARMTRDARGIGYDSHRLAAGRRLVLGGVEIPTPSAASTATPTRTCSPTR